jgi:hypothetical protein
MKEHLRREDRVGGGEGRGGEGSRKLPKVT